jgi:hypothetical protein
VISELAMRALHDGLDDWVPLAAIAGMVRQAGTSSDQAVKAATTAIVKELVDSGLAVLGEVTPQGFVPSHEPLSVAIERLLSDKGPNDADAWEFDMWLDNTAEGDAAASRAENRPGDGPART